MDAECTGCPLMWTKGYGKEILGFNGLSSDDRKYRLPTEDHGNRLIIQNIQEDDIRWNYTCSYGFEKYSNSLISERSYLYLPSNDTVTVNLEVCERTLVGEIVLEKVHPIPECNLYLNNENITATMDREIVQVGLFNKVEYTLTCNISSDVCNARLQMYCSFGQIKTTIENRSFIFTCNADRKGPSFTARIYIITVTVTFVLFSITAILIVVYRIKMNRHCEIPWRLSPCIAKSSQNRTSTSTEVDVEMKNRSKNEVCHVLIHTEPANTLTTRERKKNAAKLCDSVSFEQESFIPREVTEDVSDGYEKNKGPKTTRQNSNESLRSDNSTVSKKSKKRKDIKDKGIISRNPKPQRRVKLRPWKGHGGFHHLLYSKKRDTNKKGDDTKC